MMPVTESAVEHAIDAIEEASLAVCNAMRDEVLEQQRCEDLITSLVVATVASGNTNPLTGKPHSATSAEALAHQSVEYRAAKQERLLAECRRVQAQASVSAAKRRADLALAVYQSQLHMPADGVSDDTREQERAFAEQDR